MSSRAKRKLQRRLAYDPSVVDTLDYAGYRFTERHTFNPSEVTITIDGVELTDVLEVSYGRTKTKGEP